MKTALVFLVKSYQLIISSITAPHCRFYPSCSEYALEAIERHGPIHGAWLSVRRLLRCHPFNGGGYDPVPDQFHCHADVEIS